MKTADQINTDLLQADIEAANQPADINLLRAELQRARNRLQLGFQAEQAAIAADTDAAKLAALFGPQPEEDWREMLMQKIAAYERAIAKHSA